MGAVSYGIPTEMALVLREAFGINTFVETGTFRGNTSAWAARHFERVVTIEASDVLYADAQKRFQGTNVSVLHGKSPDVLGRLISSLSKPAMFWLDAHYTVQPFTAGSHGGECPLLDEIAVIDTSPIDHVLMIDDARLFFTAPPPPHRAEDWPGIGEVLAALTLRRPDNRLMIVDDVIFRLPHSARVSVATSVR
jgi:hypothetical protein